MHTERHCLSIGGHLRGITCRGLIEARLMPRAGASHRHYLRGITCRGPIEAMTLHCPAPGAAKAISAALLAAASLKRVEFFQVKLRTYKLLGLAQIISPYVS